MLNSRCTVLLLLMWWILSSTLVWGQSKLAGFNDHKQAIVSNELIVQFNDHYDLNQIQNSLEQYLNVHRGSIKRWHKLTHVAVLHFAEADSLAYLYQIAQNISHHPGIISVEPNLIWTLDTTLPNDALFNQLYGLHNTGQTNGHADADIDAPEAWDIQTGSQEVIVAVIDTGVNYQHEDLKENMWVNPGETGLDEQGRDKRTNGIDDDQNGYIDDWHGWDFANKDNDPMDDHGHGSHCAGIIGARGNNHVGVVGVIWNVSIVGIKFLSSYGGGSTDDAIASIEYATQLGVDIINASWGGGSYSPAMEAAITQAAQRGILFVAAAGNSSSDNDVKAHYPSSYDVNNVIAVAAVDDNDELAQFSSFGALSVDLAAPGVNILSTVLNQEYEKYSGTSMATPYVAGAAALIKAQYPQLDYRYLKRRVMFGVDKKHQLLGKTVTGGRLNVFRSLEQDEIPPAVVSHIMVTDVQRQSLDVVFLQSGDDGYEGEASYYEFRIADQEIMSEEDWEQAKKIEYKITNNENGYLKAHLVGFDFNQKGYLSIRAYDNVGNESVISPSIPFAVKTSILTYHYAGDNMDGVNPESPWGIEQLGNQSYFSDSVGAWYENNLNSSLIFDHIKVNHSDVVLAFNMILNTEAHYDFLYIEITTDGGNSWKQIDQLDGSFAARMYSYELKDLLEGSTQFSLRYRLQTDHIIQYDGALLWDVKIYE